MDKNAGISSLSDDCFHCFDYVQLGGSLSCDPDRYQLKLDATRLRLERWSKAIAVNDKSHFAPDETVETNMSHIQEILTDMKSCFQSIKRSSQRRKIDIPSGSGGPSYVVNTRSLVRGSHGQLEITVRTSRTTNISTEGWMLSHEEDFNTLVTQVTNLTNQLEEAFPCEAARCKLVQLEIEDVSDERSLLVIQNAATGTDSLLAEATAEKLQEVGRNYAKDVKSGEKARVRVGNEWTTEALAQSTGTPDRTTNLADTIAAMGSSAVHIGNMYGGRSVFD